MARKVAYVKAVAEWKTPDGEARKSKHTSEYYGCEHHPRGGMRVTTGEWHELPPLDKGGGDVAAMFRRLNEDPNHQRFEFELRDAPDKRDSWEAHLGLDKVAVPVPQEDGSKTPGGPAKTPATAK